MRRLHAMRVLPHAHKRCTLLLTAALMAAVVLVVSPAASGAGPTLGTQTLGPSSDYNPPGWAEVFPSTASASGTVDSLNVYVDGASTAQSLVTGLYADSNGAPGALLAQGSKTAVAGTWNAVSIPAVSLTAGKTYWIAVLGPTGTLYYRDSCCSGSKAYVSSATNLKTLPASWSGTSTYNAGPVSAYASAAAAAKDTAPPSTPTGLKVTSAAATSITLSWTASTDNTAVTGYDAYVGSTKAGTSGTTSYTFTGLTCGTSYTLGVDAYDAAPNVSPKATLVTSTSTCATSAGALGTQTLAPSSDYNPQGWAEAFSAVASTSGPIGGLRVYVDAQSTASSLVVGLYADTAGAPGSLIAQGSVPPVAGAWNNVPLSGVSVTAGKTYWIALLGPTGTLYYRDSCCSGAKAYVSSSTTLTSLPGTWSGTSIYSAGPASAYAYSPSSDTSAPTAPSGLKTTASTQTSVSLSWTASTDNVGVTSYGAYANGSLVGSPTGTSYTVSGLSCGTTYTFAVDAADAAGNRSGKPSITAATAACSTPPPPTGSASVFLATGGSDSNACTSAAPCKSFDRAYRVAKTGQIVEVAGGSYPDQTVGSDSSKTGPGIVAFQPKAGATVNVANMTVDGASFVKFTGLAIGFKFTVQNVDPSRLGSNNVSFASVTAQTFDIVGRVSNIDVQGTFGNTDNHQPQISKGDFSFPDAAAPANVTIHDSVFSRFTASGSQHNECLQIIHGNTIKIQRNKFSYCDGTGALGITDGPIYNLTIENNWIMGGGSPGYGAQITGNIQNLIFRNNSSTQDVFFSDSDQRGPYKIVGNYMPFHSWLCRSGVTYSRNVIQGSTCGGTDITVPSLDFMSTTNLHLKPGANAINKGDSADYPGTDIDGQNRPMGTAPDAGADEAG